MASTEPQAAAGVAEPLRLAEVPLPRHEPLRLLDLHERRERPEHDYEGYGWALVDELVLEAADGTRRVLEGALVLALHSADEQVPGAELELELDLVDPAGEELTVLAPLRPFLDAHLGGLPPAPADVVLALCNPIATPVARPAALLPSRRLHYAHGDVTSWLDVYDDGTQRIRLHADSWHQR